MTDRTAIARWCNSFSRAFWCRSPQTKGCGEGTDPCLECTLILRSALATLSGSACNNWKRWCAVRENFWLYCGNTPEGPCFLRVELPQPLLDLSNRQPEAKTICLWRKLYPMGTQRLKHLSDVINLFFKCFFCRLWCHQCTGYICPI